MDAARFGVRALADASGIDKGTISLWRTWDRKDANAGKSISIQVDKVRKVAKELNTTAEYLLDLSPGGSDAAPAGAAQRALLKRIAAMKSAIAQVDEPTQALAAALAGSQQKMTRLSDLLPELLAIAEEAGREEGPTSPN
jgi:hypothetical protein